jgi:hypothetical protein
LGRFYLAHVEKEMCASMFCPLIFDEKDWIESWQKHCYGNTTTITKVITQLPPFLSHDRVGFAHFEKAC